ncbi:helix-turn-helix domain-containing protein [Rhodovulum euryhalinum]|uniref:Helix-turn-helix protein n=1 Tax=Rhodovulum euryhalinum TaxID=35805 RepID=A0A4R2KGM9_9RHOB|nr:helix-turn-helix transcriptional regulator [Rhodovulum euryhalinum]TCO71562.1 helix-turn-helix protein [Rhodovulum euryhalinum]
MDGKTIRHMRRRLGVTQRQLADRLDVDQGTVSRWERGVERPRPRREAELLKLLRDNEDRRHLARSLALVRHDVQTAALLDARLRLVEVSATGRAHFRARGYDPSALLGTDFERYTDRLGCPELAEHLLRSGLQGGDSLLFRFTANFRGAGHTTIWEPLLEDGRVVGVLTYVASYFAFPDNGDVSIERVDFIPADGSDLVLLHEGVRSGAIRQGPAQVLRL